MEGVILKGSEEFQFLLGGLLITLESALILLLKAPHRLMITHDLKLEYAKNSNIVVKLVGGMNCRHVLRFDAFKTTLHEVDICNLEYLGFRGQEVVHGFFD